MDEAFERLRDNLLRVNLDGYVAAPLTSLEEWYVWCPGESPGRRMAFPLFHPLPSEVARDLAGALNNARHKRLNG